MKSNYLKSRIAGTVLSALFVLGIGVASSVAVQAQWPNQDRDYRRDDRNGQNGVYNRNGRNGESQVAISQGYQDGMYTGENDARRGQNYDPQRSHFYRNGHGNNGSYGNNGRNGNGYGYEQAYRQGFLRGYDEGFRRNSGYNRRGNTRNSGRWPFPVR